MYPLWLYLPNFLSIKETESHWNASPADTLSIAGMGLQSIGGNTEILNVAHVDS